MGLGRGIPGSEVWRTVSSIVAGVGTAIRTSVVLDV